MAGQLASVGEKNALDGALGRATQTARTVYLVLLTAAPSDTTTMATMTEVFAPGVSGYNRQTVAWTAPSGSPSSTANTATITFGPFTADPANVTHCAVVSASTGTSGDFIAYWTLDVAKDAALNESIQVAAGGLVLNLT